MSGLARREVITLLGGVAAAWPLVARAQQSERMRRIGVLINRAADDTDGQARLAAFQQGLQELGWNDGRNVQIDTRWGADDVDRERRYAAELVALAPDVVLASGTLSVAAFQVSAARCRSCSRAFPIRSARASSIAWPGRAATPLAS
jgi:putative tryptophan/tyrosine transport system substrate-binding protein